jgi:hypothetical protein
MSIEIGVSNNRYGKNPFIEASKNESFTINSYKTPDTIQLNTSDLSFSNVYISYKNFKTGVDDTGFSIYKESLCLATFNSNVITTFQDAEFRGSFAIGDILSVQSNMNTNITINLEHDADVLNINSNNVPFFQINPKEINFSRDFRMNDGTFYVKKIQGPSAGDPIVITNVKYEDAVLDSVIASTRLAVLDTKQFNTIFDLNADEQIDNKAACIEINKTNNIRDFMKIESIAVIDGGQIMNINKYGNINIGKNEGHSESTINISKISPNIINYNGLKSGDIFQISQNADISVGTTSPDAQLHIKRNDGENIEDETFYRNNTMMYLDMHYNEENNYSNYYVQKQGNFDQNSKPEYRFVEEDLRLYLVNQEILDNPIPIQDSFVTNDTLTLDIRGTTSYEIDDVVYDDDFKQFLDNNTSNISLIYPAQFKNISGFGFNIIPNPDFETLAYVANVVVPTTGNDRKIKLLHKIVIDNPSLFGSSSYTSYQTCNINLYTRQYKYGQADGDILNCTFDLELIIESEDSTVDLNYDYKILESTMLPVPNFFKLDSNNNFISSISANGTLSLGAEVPEDKKDYLIYAPGKSHIETLNVSNFSTDNTNNILYFGNANLSNINSIQTQSISIKNLAVDTITSPGAEFTNLSVEDISFDVVSSDFLKYNNIYTNISNKLIVGEIPSSITQNSLLEINVNDDRKGLIIQNTGNRVDPCLEIISKGNETNSILTFTNFTDSSDPSVSSEQSSMNIKYFNDPPPNGECKFLFQIYSPEPAKPKVLNYCSTENLLAIGGNAICINYNNLYRHKITLGIRDLPDLPEYLEEEKEKKYLHQEFIKHDGGDGTENVVIYGNLKIATKTNEVLIQTLLDGQNKGKIIFETDNILYKRGDLRLNFDQIVQSIFESSFSSVLQNVIDNIGKSGSDFDLDLNDIFERIREIAGS